jgi:hypothetical protein
MSACCGVERTEKKTGWARRITAFARWAIPSALLALMPKCPACLAAYVAAASGLGLSMSTAAWLRTGAIALCVAALAWALLATVRAARAAPVPRVGGTPPTRA